MADTTELALLKETERALMRLNPPLLVSGGWTETTTDTARPCLCAWGAYIVHHSARGRRVEPGEFAGLTALGWINRAPLHPTGLVNQNETFKHNDNAEKTCRARHKYVLAWVRRRIREESAASK